MGALPAYALLVAAAVFGSASSLAGAAFFEGIRRAMTPRAERALTMADVPRVPATVPDVAAVPVVSDPVVPAGSAADAVTKADTPKGDDEATWRERMMTARHALERDRVLADALQGRVNGLTSEMLARDDPKQREELARQRARAVAELDRLTLQVEKDALLIAQIEEDARKKGIPPGWIR